MKKIIFLILFYLANSNNSFKDNKEIMSHFASILDKIDKEYVADFNKDEFVAAAINGGLGSLDPYSSYYADDDLEQFLSNTKGEFGGIGVEISYRHGVIKIITPIDGLPADKVGIKAGDYITKVEGESVIKMGFHNAIKKLRGPIGTKVKITVFRAGMDKDLKFELMREAMKFNAIKHSLDKDILYLRLPVFNENTFSELEKAINEVQAKNKIKGIILDLRNNPGGLLQQAVSVSEFFIESGVIVNIKGRENKNNKENKYKFEQNYSASKYARKNLDLPLVVLINEGSASAAEIVAGAIQDYKRGVILGTRSFGKASVQHLIPISKQSAVKLTIAYYYTPLGRNINHKGIQPDIVVEQIENPLLTAQANNKIPKDLQILLQKENEESKKINGENISTLDKSQDNLIKQNDQDSDISKDKKIDDDLDRELETLNRIADYSEMYKTDYQYSKAFDLIVGMSIYNKK